MNYRKQLAGFALALIAVFYVSGCKPAADKKAPKVTSLPVETLIVSTQQFVDRVEVSGIVEPIEEVKVAAEAPGRVLKAPFEEGDEIKKGQLLLRVDSTTNSAQIDVLKNQLATAKREFERTKQLANQGLATPQQLDQIAAQVDGAALSVKQARVGMGKTNVRSPISGFVAVKAARQGEYVNPGTPLAHIVDYRTVKVTASIPESDVRYIEEGKEVDIWLPALELKTKGKVARRAIVATAKTRTFPVEIHVSNQDLQILPGMRARVIVPRKDWGEVVIVPRDAILQGFDGQEAMVFTGEGQEGKASLHKVQTGPASGNRVVITDGLQAGERLIVRGHRSLVDGTSVRVVNEAKPAANEKPKAKAHVEEAEPDKKLAEKKQK